MEIIKLDEVLSNTSDCYKLNFSAPLRLVRQAHQPQGTALTMLRQAQHKAQGTASTTLRQAQCKALATALTEPSPTGSLQVSKST